MMQKLRGLLVLGVMLSGIVAIGGAEKADEMVDNPKFKFWANFKPGATSTYDEATKFFGAEKSAVPGGIEHKTIHYRLLSVTKDKAVVLTTVVEEDFLQT